MESLNVKSIELEKTSFHQDILDIETALREFNIQSITNPNETPLYNFELEERRAENTFQPILRQKDFRAQLAVDIKKCFLGDIEIRPPYQEEYKKVSKAQCRKAKNLLSPFFREINVLVTSQLTVHNVEIS